jgi:acyl-coenzyme A synthetase/AMP-(fatty) acid ligase
VTEVERQHRVRFAFAPGVDVRHRATFEERYRIPIVEAWAMTETGGAAATTTRANRPALARAASAGHRRHGVSPR